MYVLESLVKALSDGSSSKELSWLVKNVSQLCFQTQTSSIASTAIDGILWCYHYTWSITTLTLTVTCCCTATNKPTRHTERDVADISSLLLFLLPVPPCVPQLRCDRLLRSRHDSCVLTMRLIRKLSIGVS